MEKIEFKIVKARIVRDPCDGWMFKMRFKCNGDFSLIVVLPEPYAEELEKVDPYWVPINLRNIEPKIVKYYGERKDNE